MKQNRQGIKNPEILESMGVEGKHTLAILFLKAGSHWGKTTSPECFIWRSTEPLPLKWEQGIFKRLYFINLLIYEFYFHSSGFLHGMVSFLINLGQVMNTSYKYSRCGLYRWLLNKNSKVLIVICGPKWLLNSMNNKINALLYSSFHIAPRRTNKLLSHSISESHKVDFGRVSEQRRLTTFKSHL